jgi:hypothetical protein
VFTNHFASGRSWYDLHLENHLIFAKGMDNHL